MKVACEAFESWKRVSGPERARFSFRAAAIMRRRKHEFSAFMVLEIGKSWAEADADTAEAIDFMEFYGREMIRLSQPTHRSRSTRAKKTNYTTFRLEWASSFHHGISRWQFLSA